MLIYIIWSDYRGMDQLVLKKVSIHRYKPMGVHTDDRSTETIIFERCVPKYVRVTAIMTFDQVYVTDHNYN